MACLVSHFFVASRGRIRFTLPLPAVIGRGKTMSYKRKSWREKLANNKDFPKVCKIDSAHSKRWGTGTFVIPAPMEVNELMSQVPKGKVTTIDELRKILARRHGATIACPITTGIFAWISAHAAAEAEAEGQKNPNPYWRTLKSKGQLNPKYPGGIAGLKRKLSAEGHQVVQKGKRFFVQELQDRLAVFETRNGAARSPRKDLSKPPRSKR
jgi:alkylated DNA nucleotide flippase Atl1